MILASTSGAKRKALLSRLDEIKSTPFLRGDFQQRDAHGRLNEVVLLDDWLFIFWTDHATTEVHIVSLEQVEE